MNQEILKEVLVHSNELAKKAEGISNDVFKRLSPECQHYKLSAAGKPLCMPLFAAWGYDPGCKKETCPLLRTLTDKELEEIETEIEESGLGHA